MAGQNTHIINIRKKLWRLFGFFPPGPVRTHLNTSMQLTTLCVGIYRFAQKRDNTAVGVPITSAHRLRLSYPGSSLGCLC